MSPQGCPFPVLAWFTPGKCQCQGGHKIRVFCTCLVLHATQWDGLVGLSPAESKQGGGDSSEFSHVGLESISVEVKSKNQFHLSVEFAIFIRQIYFFLDKQFATFLFFTPVGIGQPELLFSPAQRCSAQCCTACFIWKEYFLFMLVKSLFFEARRFCLRKWNPLKVLYNYLHDYLKCLPWLCSELRGVDRQPTAYRRPQFFLWGGGMEFWRLLASGRVEQAVILYLWRDVCAWGGEPSSNVTKWMMDEFCVGCRCLWTPHPAQLTAGLKLKSTSSCALGQHRGDLETLEVTLWVSFREPCCGLYPAGN